MTAEASALMQRGIDRLSGGTPETLAEAVACFDAAIDLRRRSLTPGDHGAAYLLAASWMNRGDALTRLGGAARLAEALCSYDEALAVLRDVPPDADPLYRRRHAIAWMNRGQTLQEQATERALDEAIRSFARAVAITDGHPEHDLLLASASINHAKALLTAQPPRSTAARHSALRALERVRETEARSPLAAEIHLKAQILCCRVAETSLATVPEPAAARELICMAGDAVETGLGLSRRREERGETCLGSLPTILFRYGLDFYRRRQPQFLAEFIHENLQGSVSLEWHRLAVETLASAACIVPQDGFAFLNTPRHVAMVEARQILRFVEQRIRELKQCTPETTASAAPAEA